MGHVNETCDAGTTSAMPWLLRQNEENKRWQQWSMTVVGQSPEGEDLVTIRTSYPTGRAPL